MQERVPWWGLVSSTAAPVLLIGGWTVAARLQPAAFDSTSDTISALAALGAQDRWVMTTALAGVGACHIVTALALRPFPRPGRLLLGAGGVATLLVAAFPLPEGDGDSVPHTVVAGAAFVALAAWPALSWRRGARSPAPVRPVVALGAATVLLGLLGWFGAELAADDGRVELAERVTAGAQALWPLAAVIASRRR
ncbi:MAG: DUF998 domain-containing protein [Sporichthyaceae bacterium]